MKIYTDPAGYQSPHPFDRNDALRSGDTLYSGPPCPSHAGKYTTRYAKTGECLRCARDRSTDVFNAATGRATVEGGTVRVGGRYPTERSYPPADLASWLETANRPDVTPDPHPCKRAGHPGAKNAAGKCVYCSAASPRQEALAAGETRYRPADPCPKCGGSCRRRVANGRPECVEKAPESAHAALMRLAPDTVISRETARAAGLATYRTGRPCKRGHIGWRYVSSGGCLDCHTYNKKAPA